ncbi:MULTISPECIES: MFS transporter [unclassified Sphingomonas]|uniref:MFS transporter n=1 Tax=unclassified Sphingomonas TaxID=196159 RepID=UPI0006F39C8F|nr:MULTISPECIES: MFS transporter [unclassified Sphingomonas]KQM62325.1 MFS transporter [Sphingomonas sp. Leaf16]KQN13729.1 MFS transporter [Sphingomonas sp. Leaf29]KQN23041.1 MFS transporter [Sphingomonas sp. Leaf32]
MTAPAGNRRWVVVTLVFCAIMLNYVDRQILALLKPTLEVEFTWSDQDYGNMVSAFQFAAAIAFLGTGWFIDRVGLRIGFALGVAVWSVAGMAHAFATTVAGFVGARVVLGAAESIGTPGAVKSAATYFKQKDRSIALGIGNTAPNIGAILTPLAIPALAAAFGWRAAFLVAGGLGLVWVVAWFRVRLPPPLPDTEGSAPIRWGALFRDRRTLAIAIAKVLSDQVWFFMLSWLPDLFHRLFGLAQGQVGLPVAIVYVLAACGALSGGWLPTRLIARGWSVDRARKSTLLLYALLILPVPVVLSLQSPWTASLILGLGLFAHQGFSTNVFALTTDVMPARSVGSTIGIAAFCGNMGSIFMIQLSAWSLGHGWGYTPMLLICAFSYLAALGVIQLLIPRIAPAR